ncbi:DUF3263 domain-containing protein [Micromonospora sp. CPCC 206060]|uniref:DUF3263 domain-containing protein n=1 Tax=Micromonospora sp. CPCC 206060 TaxID=3122406 RepID=UPI003FA5A14A
MVPGAADPSGGQDPVEEWDPSGGQEPVEERDPPGGPEPTRGPGSTGDEGSAERADPGGGDGPDGPVPTDDRQVATALPADGRQAATVPTGNDGLTERERDILAFEQRWWRHAGAKEQAIRDTFGLSATRYYQLLNALLDNPAALAAEPLLIGRLRRLRASRARSRRR